ncbi:tripartite tricarboxylate transporter TctB family protein [Candidatus Formimonas warabiya]|uniref:DUF1468 domain-containing protein n=1 Tax=Formimonas warabiya TaxID=1761012 RepID=A0A3G1KNG8_FORW1|nr:tripartite tricarboxylate transporter TctB family protein [Candidatus Formimonas warabiya]ATW24009.1 hypothetical protein DCMF_03665 [Candidatus Formimonas warabiya]
MEKRTAIISDYAITFLFFAASVFAFIYSARMLMNNPGADSPGLFPALLTAVMIICCIGALLGIRKKSAQVSFRFSDKKRALWETLKDEFPVPMLVMTVMAVLAYVVLLPLVGYNITSFLFIFGSILYLRREKVLHSLLVTIAFMVISQVIFVYIFKVVFP